MSSQPKVGAAPFIPRVEDPSPFPEAERVIYNKNPLESVICQLRFPAILKISSEPPVAFQDALRKHYPLFREVPSLDMAAGVPRELSALMGKLLPAPATKAYELSSEDGIWQIVLTQESLALTCKKYHRWEQFEAALETARSLLLSIYEPPFFTRIGLRYRDVISRYGLGLRDVPWDQLLTSELAGELHSRIAESVEQTWHQLVLRLQTDAAKVTLQHGLGIKDGGECYIIDCDFYTVERTGVQDAGRILDYFNRQAGRFFKWCIAERLHAAMEPNPIR